MVDFLRKLMVSPVFYAVVFLLGGGGCLLSAVSGKESFLSHGKARPVVFLLGRNGARLFYGLLGLGLMAFGLFLLLRRPSLYR